MKRRRRAGLARAARTLAAAPLLALLLLSAVAGLAIAADPAPAASSPARSPIAAPAASPAASPAGDVAGPVDARSNGEGPGFRAEPLVVLFGVLALGLAAAGGTWLYVRLTREG